MYGMLLVVAGLSAGAEVAQPVAQPKPPAPPGLGVIVTDKCDFRLPIRIAEGVRPGIKSVRLFVSTNMGATWKLQEEVNSEAEHFKYHAATEGLYWFSIQTIDKKGRATPADIAKEPPGLQVHVVRKKMPER